MFKKRIALFGSAAMIGMLPSVAQGAEASDLAAGAAEGQGTLDEIVVTAQKVPQNLQKAALSVTTIDAASLEKSGIRSVADLTGSAPSIVVTSTPSNPLSITIRGAGFEGIRNDSSQPGVSLNQNGVFIASSVAAAAAFFDVDQIEVLRGPQGTVLGQSSNGGAINVRTVQPRLGTFEGNGDISYGSFNYDRVRLGLNLPVGSDVAVRLAVQQQKHDGSTVASGVPGEPNYKLGNESSLSGRLSALWQISDQLKFDVWIQHYRNRANGDAFKNIYDPSPDPYVVTQDVATKLKQDSTVGAARLTYDMGWSSLEVIGSYQGSMNSAPQALDKLDYANAIRVFGVHDISSLNWHSSRAATGEIDLRSPTDGKLTWIVGAFIMQRSDRQYSIEYQDKNFRLTYPSDYNDPDAIYATGALSFAGTALQTIVTGSAYAQGTYNFSDHLRLTAGGRLTKSRQTGDISVYFGAPVRLETDYTAATGKVNLEYDIGQRSTVYAMWASGMKPGGLNLNPTSVQIPMLFDPETVHSFELGSKNEFLGRRLRLNTAAFYNIYKGLQVDSEDPIPYSGGMTNVRRADIYGVEAELTAILPAGFRLDGGISVMAGQVKSHQQLLDPAVAQRINLETGGPFVGNNVVERTAAFFSPGSDIYGKTPPKVPEFSSRIALSQRTEFKIGTLTTNFRYVHVSPYFFRVYNAPEDRVPAYDQFDMDVMFETANGKYFAQLNIKNLTDKASVISKYTDDFGVGAISYQYVSPRQIVGRLGVRF